VAATGRALWTPLLLGAALLAGSRPVRAAEEKPQVTVLRVTPRGADVFLDFQLTGVLNPELARQYRYWFDNFLDSRHYDISVTFDPVTREYVVVDTLDNTPLSRTTTADFRDVERLLVSRDNLLAFHVGPDWPQRNLVVHMRAAFDSGYLFSFIPVDYRTPWKKSKKFGIGAAGAAR